jgi:biopolymer transport protein ExbB/TolQ
MVLRTGPAAWFASPELEALRTQTEPSEVFTPCPDQGIARALADAAPGATVTLPYDASGRWLPTGNLIAEGGPIMVPLLVLSALATFILLERLLTRGRIVAEARATLALFARDRAAALARRDRLARVLARPDPGEGARAVVLEALRKRLWVLGTIAASAPFVGLFGTVVGIVRAFRDMAKTGSSGFAVVAAGISEALVATAAGIVVALLAVVAFNALGALASHAADRIRDEVDEALGHGS